MKKLFLFCIFLLTFKALSSQLPKGERILSWHVGMSENGNYDSAMGYARRACMESVPLFVSWRSIEDSAGVFNRTFLDETLRVANFYYSFFGIPVELQLAPVNTVRREVPADLEAIPFDDPEMIRRFKILLDTLFARIPDLTLTTLSIGNEMDGYLGTDMQAYLEYRTFLDSVIPHARKRYAALHGDEVLTGTTFMFSGLLNPATKNLCKLINSGRDFIAVTYYPLNPDFTMKPPSVVFSDFERLTAEYPDTTRPIHLVECGYASSPVCNSSEALQAEFYKNVFAAWDRHAAQISLISFFKLTDWSQAVVEELAGYYGLPNHQAFKEYLRSLGVRSYPGDGENKAAYETILCELAARNWCSVTCKTTGTENLQEPEGRFYPNPVHGTLHLSGAAPVAAWNLYDAEGRLRLSGKGNDIDFSAFSPGLYLLDIEYVNGERMRGKIIKP